MEKLLAIVDSMTGIPEPFHKFYVKKPDGKFWLQVESVGTVALEDVGALKNAAAEASAERTQLKAKLAKIPDGFDIEAAQAAMKKVDEIKNWKPDQKAQELIDAQVLQFKAKFETENSELKSKNEAVTGELESVLIDAAVLGGFSAHKLVEGGQDLLKPHVRPHLKVFEEGGKRVVRVVTGTGAVRPSMKSGSGTSPMEVGELIGTMKAEKPFSHAFLGSGASGTGTKGSGGGSGGSKMPEGMNPTQRLAHIRREQQAGAAG